MSNDTPNNDAPSSEALEPTVPRKRAIPERTSRISERHGTARRPVSATQPATNAPPTVAPNDAAADGNEATVAGTRPMRRKRPILRPVVIDTLPDKDGSSGDGEDGVMASGFARYRLGEELGRGGMGIVRAAIDPAFRRELAIKVLLDTRESHTATQFIEEAQITGQLEHPNIVPVHELGRDPHGRPFLAMKRVQGKTLRDVIRETENQRRPWKRDEAELLGVFRKICEAMAYAHSRGVIHRDLKPENIMVGEFGEVLVMDWGLAKPLGTETVRHPNEISGDTKQIEQAKPAVMTDRRTPIRPNSGRNSAHGDNRDDRRGTHVEAELTVDGQVFGTPSYMAPEQARGDHANLDERADIFALGAILYALLACRAPYSGKSAVQILGLARDGRFEAADRVTPWREVPKELAAIAAKAMAFEPAHRYPSAHDLLADLTAYQAFEPITARRDHFIAATVKWMRRHPRITLVSALSVVFALIVSVLAVQLQAAQQMAAIEAERADQQAALAAAETARAADAERVALVEAARAADAEAVAQERHELLRQMRAGDYGYVLGLLEAQVRSTRDAAIEELLRLHHAARAANKSDEQFFSELGAEKVDDYLAAFDRLFEQHEKRGIKIIAQDYFYRGLLRHAGKHDYERAIRDYDRAIAINPDYRDAHYNRGLAKASMGDDAAAIRDYERAIQIDPKLAIAYYNCGNSRVNMGDHIGAIRDYDGAIQITPEFAVAYYNRGNSKRALGDHAEAIRDFDRAIQFDPKLAIAYYNRGNSKADMGNRAEAIRDFDYAIQINPELAEAYFNRGAAKANMGNRAEAIRDYDRAIEINPDYTTAYNNRGNAKMRMRDYAGAMRDFDHAIQLNPDYADAHFNRGLVKANLNDYAGAIRGFDRAIQITPQHWQAWAMRGQMRITGNIDHAEGVRDLQQAHRLCDDPHTKSQIANLLRQVGGTVPE